MTLIYRFQTMDHCGPQKK